MLYRRVISFLFLLFVLSVFPAISAAQDDAAEAHKTIIRGFYDEAVNAGNVDLMDEVFAADYVNYGFGEDLDVEGFKAMIESLRTAMPDFAAIVEVLIAEDEWAASRVRYCKITAKTPFPQAYFPARQTATRSISPSPHA